jgi:hypothetical protein
MNTFESTNALSVTHLKGFTEHEMSGISADIRHHQINQTVWYRASQGLLADGTEPFLSALLLPAMKLGASLHVPGSASSGLLSRLPIVQDIFHNWCPELHRVPVDVAPTDVRHMKTGSGIGTFFSGGVDSFYSFFRHRGEITHLIFIKGFDIFLDNLPLLRTVAHAVRRIAEELGVPLIEVETNLRSFADRHVSWTFYHGAALASVAHLLSPQFRKIYLPSSHSYSQLFPWGSHPLLDPLWSTDTLDIIHDGSEASRVEKVQYLSEHEVVLKHLRVCWENLQGAYNCSQCEKCLRTMVSLRIAGALDRATTFSRSLDLEAVARVELPDENARMFVEENLHALEKTGTDHQLTHALRDCLQGRYHRGLRKKAHHALDAVLDMVKTFQRAGSSIGLSRLKNRSDENTS